MTSLVGLLMTVSVFVLPAHAQNKTTTVLSKDMTLPAGTEVTTAKSTQQMKASSASGGTTTGSYEQVTSIGGGSGLDATDLATYQQQVKNGSVYIPSGSVGSDGKLKAAANVYGANQAQVSSTGTPVYTNNTMIDPLTRQVIPNFNPNLITRANKSVASASPNYNPLNCDWSSLTGNSSSGWINPGGAGGSFASMLGGGSAGGAPSKDALDTAMQCYKQNPGVFTKPYIVIVDLTQPSTQPRFFVIDANSGRVLTSEYVSHGRADGKKDSSPVAASKILNATISASSGSSATPPGIHVTRNALNRGGNPYNEGLELAGLEARNATSMGRTIRIHDWLDRGSIASGTAQPTWGCLGIPRSTMQELQNKLSNGSMVFNYTGSAQDKALAQNCPIMRR